MDKLIRHWDAVQDADLMLCEPHGVAYQRNMKMNRVSYDAAYLAKVTAYEGTAIAKAVNAGRVALLSRYLSAEKPTPTTWPTVIDVGAGTGAFVLAAKAAGYDAKGFDVGEVAIPLKVAGLYDDNDLSYFDAVTMWDSIEHMEDPWNSLKRAPKGALLFVSIPVFTDLRKIRESKHYRPGEHLYYWTESGFIEWAALYGFRHLETSTHETEAGREDIAAFAFRKELPDYNDHIAAYDQIHSSRHYGSSSAELHLDAIADVVRRVQPASIIDYGCGRSDLVAHFWLDGGRRIERYDPAIPRFKDMPEGEFDLAFVCDVLEHIPMASVDRVLAEVREKSAKAVFTISTKLARAKLPDGRNAHVTLLTAAEWCRWIAEVFGEVELIPSKWEHELIVTAGIKRREAQKLCACGGELQRETFDSTQATRTAPRHSQVEHLMRCRNCGAITQDAKACVLAV